MGDAEAVTPEVCKLRHELVDSNIRVVDARVDSVNTVVTELKSDIGKVYDMQRQTLIFVIIICVVLLLTAFGVLLGRSIDFGWLAVVKLPFIMVGGS
jgi:hypothetical protein